MLTIQLFDGGRMFTTLSEIFDKLPGFTLALALISYTLTLNCLNSFIFTWNFHETSKMWKFPGFVTLNGKHAHIVIVEKY